MTTTTTTTALSFNIRPSAVGLALPSGFFNSPSRRPLPFSPLSSPRPFSAHRHLSPRFLSTPQTQRLLKLGRTSLTPNHRPPSRAPNEATGIERSRHEHTRVLNLARPPIPLRSPEQGSDAERDPKDTSAVMLVFVPIPFTFMVSASVEPTFLGRPKEVFG
ncbi:hypothetical protein NMY22_g8108 [Coprinellus aureogranulatus]|nr:hypothetical protein NMY22_g8108 [Coprinellus aureogranulatus]